MNRLFTYIFLGSISVCFSVNISGNPVNYNPDTGENYQLASKQISSEQALLESSVSSVEESLVNTIDAGLAASETTLPPGAEDPMLELGGYACNIVHNPGSELIWSIHLYNLDSSLTDSRVVYGVTQNRKIQSVACTPDGSFLVFSVKDSTAGDYEVYAINLLKNEVIQLTDNDDDDVDVTLSGDGLVVAWQQRLTDGRQAIAVRTYNKGRESFIETGLASASPFVQPSLSANGKWMALVQLRTNNFLALRYNVETKEFLTVKSIVRRKKLFHPSVSNDGLIFGWLENNNQGRYMVKDLATDEDHLVLQEPEGIRHPLISSDGSWVIYSLNNETERVTKLTHLKHESTLDIGVNLSEPMRYLGSYWSGQVELLPLELLELNDTGITQCSDADTSGLICPVANYPNQDAQYGRDVTSNEGSDGHAGFSFTKLDASGNELLANATDWSCVKDNVTGLIWEVKQGGNGTAGDEGLHDADDRYKWYSTDDSNNGGFAGYENDGDVICHAYNSGTISSYCNTQAFVDRVNQVGLCGANDWRLPSPEILLSIVSYGHAYPTIDTDYFPQTQSDGWYWSSSPYAGNDYLALSFDFDDGLGNPYNKNGDLFVRLVRSGQ